MRIAVLCCIVTFCVSCSPTEQEPSDEIVSVSVRKNDKGQFRLFRNGEEYYVKGAGGYRHLDLLSEYGGNSIRIWNLDEAKDRMDEAHKNGLTVMAGLWVQHERHGFDYDNEEKVREQLLAFEKKILEIKDHPALLMWAVGNEVDLAYSNTKVWHAVEDIARMIKKHDPNHPVTTVTAGLDSTEVQLIKQHCPSIDIYGINTYGDLPSIPKKIRAYGWTGPYLIAEWGPTGHWETDSTEWGVPIEETSKQKASVYKQRYMASMGTDLDQCIGSYVFLWGQKQETTPTWYGIFTENDRMTEVGDVLYELWHNKPVTKPGPSIDSVTLNDQTAYDDVYLESGQQYQARAYVDDHGQPLEYKWEIMPESTDKKMGGDSEKKPEILTELIKDSSLATIELTAPERPGPYRLFVYAENSERKVALANIPFYIK